MHLLRRWLIFAMVAFTGSVLAQAPQAAASPLDPLASWIGGRWVGTLKTRDGATIKLIRTYEWSFDRRLIVGRSFGEAGGKTTQSRETVYFWNPESRRIEFTDFIDQGGYGVGAIDVRAGVITMAARIVGNGKHPHWRAWITSDGPNVQVIRVEADQQGKWVDFGTYPYQRER